MPKGVKKQKKVPVVPTEPVVTKGSHLTVTTYPSGRVELEWDWDALIRDVQEAIGVHEAAIAQPTKKKRKKRDQV